MWQTLTSNALIYGITFFCGASLGFLRGGSLAAIRGVRITAWPVLVAGVIFQMAAEAGAPGALSLAVIGTFLLIVGLGLNVGLRGATITNIGLMLNITVITLNGHMPVRVNALKETGMLDPTVDETTATITLSGFSAVETPSTILPMLGDVLGRFPLMTPMSFGDLTILAGLVVLLQNLMLDRSSTGVSVDDLFGPDEFDDDQFDDDRFDTADDRGGSHIDLTDGATTPGDHIDRIDLTRRPAPRPLEPAATIAAMAAEPTFPAVTMPEFQPWADPEPYGVPAGIVFPTDHTAMEHLSSLPYDEGDVRVVPLRAAPAGPTPVERAEPRDPMVQLSGMMPSPVHV